MADPNAVHVVQRLYAAVADGDLESTKCRSRRIQCGEHLAHGQHDALRPTWPARTERRCRRR
jgi:hypothetical protein